MAEQQFRVRRLTEGAVASGVFEGLRMPRAASWGNPSPMLLGCYESEIDGFIERIVESAPRVVVDVGCAEGYYAVGLARRLPSARIHAFDIDPRAQTICREAAALNAVDDRVFVHGECDHLQLETLSGPHSVFVLDCEGAELDLLDPAKVPGLRETTILVELHDFVDPGTTATILERFAETHKAAVATSAPRDHSEVPALARLPKRVRALAVDEQRPMLPHPMQWAYLVPTAV